MYHELMCLPLGKRSHERRTGANQVMLLPGQIKSTVSPLTNTKEELTVSTDPVSAWSPATSPGSTRASCCWLMCACQQVGDKDYDFLRLFTPLYISMKDLKTLQQVILTSASCFLCLFYCYFDLIFSWLLPLLLEIFCFVPATGPSAPCRLGIGPRYQILSHVFARCAS